jgi:hypothetical protein
MFFKIERRFSERSQWIPLWQSYALIEDAKQAFESAQKEFPFASHRLVYSQVISEVTPTR